MGDKKYPVALIDGISPTLEGLKMDAVAAYSAIHPSSLAGAVW